MSTVKANSFTGQTLPVPQISEISRIQQFTATAGQTQFTLSSFDWNSSVLAFVNEVKVSVSWVSQYVINISGVVPVAGNKVTFVAVGRPSSEIVISGVSLTNAFLKTSDKQSNINDATPGKITIVGAFGGIANSSYRYFGATGASTTVDWNTVTEDGTFSNVLRGNNANGPGGTDYFYVKVDKLVGTSTITQTAIPYSGGAANNFMYFRTSYNGTWNPWVRLLVSTNLQTSQSDNAVGRILTTGAFGWNGGNAVTLANAFDVLTLTTSGLYYVNNATNGPAGFSGLVFVETASTDRITLTAKQNNGIVFTRTKNEGTWESSWRRIWTSSDFVVVGQSNFFQERKQTLGNVSGSPSVDIASGSYIEATSVGATTWTFSASNLQTNHAVSFTLKLTNGGLYTQNFFVGASAVKWANNSSPVFSSSATDVITFVWDGTHLIGTLSVKGIV